MALLSNTFPEGYDAGFSEVAALRADAALAWGHLQGQLAYCEKRIAELFAVGAARAMCDEALRQAGFPDAPLKLPRWFAGQALNVETAHVAAPARDIVVSVLQTLRASSWAPMAAVADRLCASNCMLRDPSSDVELLVVEEAIAEGEAILTRLNAPTMKDADWPLAIVDKLHAEAALSPLSSPDAVGAVSIDGPDGVLHIPTPPQHRFLWVCDLIAGEALSRASSATVSIPLPGYVRHEALRAEAASNRQNRLIAESLVVSVARLSRLLRRARTVARQMDKRFAHVRSTSRAPDAYILSTGFGPLTVRQLQRAYELSRAGANIVAKAAQA